MIYTLSLNPAVDVYMDFDAIEQGKLNRTEKQKISIGGKGINVSLALKNLGIESIPIAVVGGFTGDYIRSELHKKFSARLFSLSTPTRINVKIKCRKKETEYNGINELDEKTQKAIHTYLLTLTQEDYLIVSGNAPLFIYKEILSSLKCHLILDVDGKLLKSLLYLKPWLVKPNNEELKEISYQKEEAYEILLKEAKYILHTKGKDGATFLSKTEIYNVLGKRIAPLSTVGCGDAALAGFLAAYFRGQGFQESLIFSNQCGLYRAKTGQFLIQNK